MHKKLFGLIVGVGATPHPHAAGCTRLHVTSSENRFDLTNYPIISTLYLRAQRTISRLGKVLTNL